MYVTRNSACSVFYSSAPCQNACTKVHVTVAEREGAGQANMRSVCVIRNVFISNDIDRRAVLGDIAHHLDSDCTLSQSAGSVTNEILVQ